MKINSLHRDRVIYYCPQLMNVIFEGWLFLKSLLFLTEPLLTIPIRIAILSKWGKAWNSFVDVFFTRECLLKKQLNVPCFPLNLLNNVLTKIFNHRSNTLKHSIHAWIECFSKSLKWLFGTKKEHRSFWKVLFFSPIKYTSERWFFNGNDAQGQGCCAKGKSNHTWYKGCCFHWVTSFNKN